MGRHRRVLYRALTTKFNMVLAPVLWALLAALATLPSPSSSWQTATRSPLQSQPEAKTPDGGCCALRAEFGSNSAGQLQASLEAVEPGVTPSRLQLRLSPDTPVRTGSSAAATQSSGALRLLETNASSTGADFIGAYAESSLLWAIQLPDESSPQHRRLQRQHQ